MAIQPRILGKILYQYEVERLSFYKQYSIKGFLAWQLIRRSLYYNLLRQDFFGASGSKVKTSLKTYVKAFLKFPFQLIYLLIYKRKIQSFVVANEVYKLEKNGQGKDVNVFTDHWYNLNKSSETILLEYRQGKNDPRNSNLSPDIDTNAIKFIIRILTNVLLRFKWSHPITKELHKDLKSFFQLQNQELPDSHRVINVIFIKFLVDYYLYRFLFVLFRPKVLVAADSLGTGMMAAAKRSGVKVIELQHGLLDTYKPDYIIAPELTGERDRMVVPDYLALFGDYYKYFLSNKNFWKREELIPIGNIRIDNYRAKRSSIEHKKEEQTILIPTQWNYFPETKQLLEQLRKVSMEFSLKLMIKTHPREPQNNVDWYREFCKEHSSAFLYGNETSIYELFIKTDLVIGFDSTSLLESLALGVPTITLATKTSPQGLHSYNPDLKLQSSIKVASIESVSELVSRTFGDQKFQNAWKKEISQASDYLYAKGCSDNCKNLLYKVSNN